MSTVPTLPGITSKVVDTPRLKQHVLFSGPENGTPVLFIHGNASSASYWEEIMLKLPAGFHGIAPDLRGYGDTEDKLIDATRGMGAVSYTHLRAHETVLDLVCRLLLEKKNIEITISIYTSKELESKTNTLAHDQTLQVILEKKKT